MPTVSALWKWKKEDGEFEASLDYMVRFLSGEEERKRGGGGGRGQLTSRSHDRTFD